MIFYKAKWMLTYSRPQTTTHDEMLHANDEGRWRFLALEHQPHEFVILRQNVANPHNVVRVNPADTRYFDIYWEIFENKILSMLIDNSWPALTIDWAANFGNWIRRYEAHIATLNRILKQYDWDKTKVTSEEWELIEFRQRWCWAENPTSAEKADKAVDDLMKYIKEQIIMRLEDM